MTPQLIIFGPLLVDELYFPDGKMETIAGGSALYAALGAALAGIKVGIVSTIGEDYPPDVLTKLQHFDIDLTGIKKISGRGFYCEIHYQNHQDRTIVYGKNCAAFSDVCPHFQDIPEAWWKCAGIHISPFSYNKQIDALKNIRHHLENISLSIDPVDVIPSDKVTDFLAACQLADFLLPSMRELALFSSIDPLFELLTKLSGNYLQQIILKRGKEGVLYYNHLNKTVLEFPAPEKINVIDPTGAGDTFCGAFHATMLKNPHDVATALETATDIAGITLQGLGAAALLAKAPLT